MKFNALLYLSVFMLTGCQSLSLGQGPVTDTVKAMVQRPVDFSLTSEQRSTFPYAAQYFRFENGPQALVVLARLAGPRALYASSEGRSLLLDHGRIIATHGFPVNFQYMDLPPAPRVALSTEEPICWNAIWRASGQRIASNYRLNGCLQRVRTELVAMPEGNINLVRVRETVSTSQVNKSFENIFWLQPETGQVLASLQQGGAMMPRLSLTRVIAEPEGGAVAERPQLMSAWPETAAENKVSVQYQGLFQGYAEQAASSLALVDAFANRHEIDWQESTLFRLDNTELLLRDRDALASDLSALARHWEAHKKRGLAITANAMAKDVQSWRLAHRVTAELSPHVLFLQANKRIQLKGQRYLLVLAAARRDTPVWGAVFEHELRWQGLGALDKLADSRYLRSGADNNAIWLLDNQGGTRRLGLKEWNSSPVEWEGGSRLFVGFSQSLLPAQWSDMNTRLLALARHRLP